jgi:hypothetical protein
LTSADIEITAKGNCAIIIQTGNAKYAGTSADCRYEFDSLKLGRSFFVSILLSGSQGVYAFQLSKSLTNRIPFQNRYRDIFLVEIDEEVKQIEYIVLEHNNENSAPAWFVDFVIIKFLTNQQEYLYVKFNEKKLIKFCIVKFSCSSLAFNRLF